MQVSDPVRRSDAAATQFAMREPATGRAAYAVPEGGGENGGSGGKRLDPWSGRGTAPGPSRVAVVGHPRGAITGSTRPGGRRAYQGLGGYSWWAYAFDHLRLTAYWMPEGRRVGCSATGEDRQRDLMGGRSSGGRSVGAPRHDRSIFSSARGRGCSGSRKAEGRNQVPKVVKSFRGLRRHRRGSGRGPTSKRRVGGGLCPHSTRLGQLKGQKAAKARTWGVGGWSDSGENRRRGTLF